MYHDCDHHHPPIPYSRDITLQEFIERRYGLPPALPLIRDGHLVPIYPLYIGHEGDDFYMMSAKYIGEVHNIYDLLLKIATHQAIDPEHPLPYEFKIENNILYVRDKDNSSWIELGDVSKKLFGADDKFSQYVSNVSSDRGNIIVTKGDGTKTQFPMNIDSTYLHDVSIENGYLIFRRGDGQNIRVMLGLDITYPKDIKFENGKLIITRGNGQTVELNMNYVAAVTDQSGTIKVTDSKNVSTNILIPITNEQIDTIFEGVWGEAARGI